MYVNTCVYMYTICNNIVYIFCIYITSKRKCVLEIKSPTEEYTSYKHFNSHGMLG